eukprot:TRINITY_DN27179_c0_g2_i1.p2 TRINITY_DN27179_c0_g2~~TRINITY_DN27179_c0_g2_i1.p2  ORF type:complete len:101 (+),score=9.83 TRINITY_DN27179_c0_g2_i1:81-383(+)
MHGQFIGTASLLEAWSVYKHASQRYVPALLRGHALSMALGGMLCDAVGSMPPQDTVVALQLGHRLARHSGKLSKDYCRSVAELKDWGWMSLGVACGQGKG